MSPIQALQLWCKQQCEGYKDVSVTNMTTSFRDGLAFCAILHRHRPDLIDFTSLSKENVFENNALAFRVAEKELGIPALLDAEDMVALRVPDRLSILTYVSQYYNYFHGKSPIGGMAGVKRPASQPSEQPTEKKVVPEPKAPSSTPPSRPPFLLEPKAQPVAVGRRLVMDTSPAAERRVLAEKNNAQPSNCAICGIHVHLVQRLLMDGKLYHRNCFSGNYKAGLSPGTFLCNRHAGADLTQVPPAQENQTEKKTVTSKTLQGLMGRGSNQRKQPRQCPNRHNVTPQPPPPAQGPSNSWSPKTSRVSTSPNFSHLHPPAPTPEPPMASSSTEVRSRIQQAREKFFQADPGSSAFPVRKPEPAKNHSSPIQPAQVPEKSAISRTQVPSSSSDSKKDEARNILQHVLPGPQPSTSQPRGNPAASKPFNKPAFADPPRAAETSRLVVNLPKDPSHKLGIGAEPQNKIKDGSIGTWANAGRKSDPKVVKAKGTREAEEKLESPEDWRSMLKPDEAKPPPKQEAHKVEINIQVKPRQNDNKPLFCHLPGSSHFCTAGCPTPEEEAVGATSGCLQQLSEREGAVGIPANRQSREMEPAKTALHPDYVPEEEIQKEIRQIERNLDKLEQKGITLEKQLRACEGDDSEDALMVEWFKLIHEKQILLRRESELMHKINQQKLEVKQWDIETELRILIGKAVNNRNKIVEDLDEDRLRELEEDEMFIDMIKKFGVSQSPQENERKKNKFGFLRILKPKN
ncbi:hypothetical protein E2320_012271 [Naja naja]|nr:hypothetical protein E2320_012271 [Naja naja]